MSDTFFSGRETGFQQINPGTPARAPWSDVAGATIGQAMDEAPAFGLMRWAGRGIANMRATPESDDRLLTPEEATEQYGITGKLTFNRAMAESSARALNERARERAAREDILSRADSGAAGWTGRIALSLAASAIDPLNIASAFVPVVGVTRSAAWLAQAGSRAARVGVAARIGMIEGAVGQAILEPVNRFVASQEQRDYDMADSLLNVAFGAGFGAALHAGGRALVDGFRGWNAPPAVARDVHESAVRAAVAQVERGEPVEVKPVFDVARAMDRTEAPPARLGEPATLADLDRLAAEEGRAAAPGITEVLQAARTGRFGARNEVSLSTFLIRNGGLKDTGTEVLALLGSHRARPGLINRNGMTLDRAREMAEEAGYIGARAGDDMPDGTTTIREFLDALDGDVRGTKLRHGLTYDERGRRMEEAVHDLDQRLAERGVSFRDSDEAIFAALRPDHPEVPAALDLADAEARAGEVRAHIEAAARQAMRPEDARAVAAADAARVRSEAGARVEKPGAAADAEAAALDARMAETDAVLAELVRTGRLTEREVEAARVPEMEARTQERVKAFEAAAACMIANGA